MKDDNKQDGAALAEGVTARSAAALGAASHDAPIRIQRSRAKGWKTPPNTVYVGRPTKWGNPFEVGSAFTRQQAVDAFVVHLASYFGWAEREVAKAFYPLPVRSTEFRDWLKPLRGKNLMCWCALDQPCHADVLLELANAKSEGRQP